MNFESDVLTSISDSTLKNYVLETHKHLPSSLRGYKFLSNRLEWRMKDQNVEYLLNFNYQVYVPTNGIESNCTFVGIAETPNYYSVFIFTLESSCEELVNCLSYTKLINWNMKPRFESVPCNYMNAIDKLCQRLSLHLKIYTNSFTFRLPYEIAIQFDEILPEKVFVKKLSESDTELIDLHWPHRWNGSINYLKTLLHYNWGLGLYTLDTNQLIAWVLKNDNSAVGMLQTIESERKKGYGKFMLKLFCKRQAENENTDCIAFVVQENKSSIALLTSIGFEILTVCYWFYLHPTNEEEPIS